jgi:hypothetical protein
LLLSGAPGWPSGVTSIVPSGKNGTITAGRPPICLADMTMSVVIWSLVDLPPSIVSERAG